VAIAARSMRDPTTWRLRRSCRSSHGHVRAAFVLCDLVELPVEDAAQAISPAVVNALARLTGKRYRALPLVTI